MSRTAPTQAAAKSTLDRQGFTSNHMDCKLATKASGHANGYVKCKVRDAGERAEWYLHQLAVIADGRGDQLLEAGHAGMMECSHICRKPSCFNAAHIVVEPKEINKQRNFCVEIQCDCCANFVTNCRHNPKCLF